jgi:hypothetical protein
VFHHGKGDETKLLWDEIIFRPREDVPKPAVRIKPTTNLGPKAQQGTVMIKALSALAVAAAIAASLTLLPGFAPQVEASVPQVLAKADRLDIHSAGHDCSQRAWPNFEASCLRVAGTKASIREVRLVTADRPR